MSKDLLDPRIINELELRAMDIRVKIISMLVMAGSGHSAGPLGMAEVFSYLFLSDVFKFGVEYFGKEQRDYFILSNGHICPVYYAALHSAGFFNSNQWNQILDLNYSQTDKLKYSNENILNTLRKIGSPLQGHPERVMLPFLETTSGPLGSGLSQGIGICLGNRLKGLENKVVVVMGDGEHNEGNVWEAVMLANKYRLSNLLVIVDRNRIQIDGNTEDVLPLGNLGKKYEAFGWDSIEIDGNSIGEIDKAVKYFINSRIESPLVIIANTVPGKTVDFMENDYRWHGKPPTPEEARLALIDINEQISQLAEWRKK